MFYPLFSPKRQLNLGVEAGRYLNKIHKLLFAQKGLVKESAQNLYEKKQSQLNKYKESQFLYAVPAANNFIFRKTNYHYCNNGLWFIQHGDFHVGIYLLAN